MKLTRFEDLECWQEARKLVTMVYGAIRSNPSSHPYPYGEELARIGLALVPHA